MPRTNRDFWRDKLEENRSRDERYEAELRALGYRVFVVWECELRDDRLDQLASAIRNGATDSAWEMTK
jgi:DNA mismatch endonuclease, patch repair protein